MKFIVIQGVSGSGKSHLARFLQENIADSVLINLDWYYKEGQAITDIQDKQQIEALDIMQFRSDLEQLQTNHCYHQYYYDFMQKKRTLIKQEYIQNDCIVIIEGIHAFTCCVGLDATTIYIDKPLHHAIIDRMQRDLDPNDIEKKIKPINEYLNQIKHFVIPFGEKMQGTSWQANITLHTNTQGIEYFQHSQFPFISLLQQRLGINEQKNE